MLRFLLLVSLKFAFGEIEYLFSQVQLETSRIQTQSTCPDPLSCWLETLVFNIPDTCFDVEGKSCCITSFTCAGIALGGIDSNFIDPTSLYLGINDMGTVCSGHWSYGKLGGDLKATITQTSLTTTTTIGKEDIFPVSVQFPTCAIPGIEIKLEFSGGLIGWLLDLISGVIERGIEKSIYDIFCGASGIESKLAVKATELLVTKIDPVLAAIVAFGPSPAPASMDSAKYLDWEDTLPGLLARLTTGGLALDGLVDAITGGTGEVSLDLHDKAIVIPVEDPVSGPLGTVSVTLHQLNVSGLDTFHDIQLAGKSPTSPQSLLTTLSLASLTASLDLTLEVKLDDLNLIGGDLVEHFVVQMALSDVSVIADLLIAVKSGEAGVGSMYVDQLLRGDMNGISCLLSITDFLTFTDMQLRLHLDFITVTSKEAVGLESDLDRLINSMIQLLTDGFPELVSGVLNGIVQGPARSAVNDKLKAALEMSKSTCIGHNQVDGVAWQEWPSSKAIAKLDSLLNSKFGAQGMNSLVSTLTHGTGTIELPLSEDLVVTLFGLNSFYEFAILAAVGEAPYTLHNQLSLGYCESPPRDTAGAGAGVCTPLGLSVVKHEARNANKNDDTTTVSLYNVEAILDVSAKFDVNAFNNLLVSDLIGADGCVIASFDEVVISQFVLRLMEATVQRGRLLPPTDITGIVMKLLGVLTAPPVVARVNARLSDFLGDANIACETGEWPVDPTEDDDELPTPCEGPIQCALAQVRIGPFDFCLNVPAGSSSLKLCVEKLVCSSLTLDSVVSDIKSPHAMLLGLKGAGVSCSSSYSVEVAMPSSENDARKVSYSGELSLALKNLDAEAAIGFTRYSYSHIPSQVTIDSCLVPAVDFSLHFSGGVVGKALDQVLAPVLENVLKEFTPVMVCDLMAPLAEMALTALVTAKVDPVLKEYVDAAHAVPEPVQVPDSLDWTSSLISTLHTVIDSVQDLTQGRLLQCMLAGQTPVVFSDDQNVNIIVDVLTGGTGEIRADINKVLPLPLGPEGSSSVTVRSVVVSGLDSFQNIDILLPSELSSVTLSSVIELQTIGLKLTMELDLPGYHQESVVELSVSNVKVALDLALALGLEDLNAVYLDQILHVACLLDTVQLVELSSLALFLDVDKIQVVQVTGGDATPLEGDVVRLLDNSIELILSSFPISDVIGGIAQMEIRSAINANIKLAMEKYASNHVCDAHVEDNSPEYIEWSGSKLIKFVDEVLNVKIGSSGLNSLMNCLTQDSGTLSVLVPATSPLLAGWSVVVAGLNSFFDFSLMHPVDQEPFDLGNSIGMGKCDHYSSANCNPFSITLSGDAGGDPAYIKVGLENVQLLIDLLLKVDKNALKNLDIAQLHTTGCVMSTFDSALVTAADLKLGGAEFFFHDADNYVNLTDAATYILNLIEGSGSLQSKMNEELAHRMSISGDQCSGDYVPQSDDEVAPVGEDSAPWTWQLGLLLVGCVVAVVVLMWIYYKYGTKGLGGQCLHTGVAGEEDQELQKGQAQGQWSVAMVGAAVAAKFGYSNFDYNALVADVKIPWWVRLMFPIAVLFNISLFVTANIEVGTSVMVEIDLGNKVISPPSVFDFGLGNTVRDMWDAGVYPLSILIAFFSGAWPYIKLVSMLVSWFLPTSTLSSGRRDVVLRWLDILGKWSLLDAYVMVMMMVAFHVELEIAPGLSVIVTVLPKSGFNNFLLATMISLGLGHIVLACHRLGTDCKVSPTDSSKEALMNHVFSWNVRSSTGGMSSSSSSFASSHSSFSTQPGNEIAPRRVRISSWGKAAVLIGILTTVLIVIAGAYLFTFAFHFKGLTGYLLKSDADVDYSLISTGTSMASATGNPDSFNVRWIQAAFFGFGIVMPLGFLAVLAVLWVCPLSLSGFRQFVVLAEVTNAWNAIDVFVVSIIAALLEIHQFAMFIIGDSCDSINKVLKQSMPELGSDATCFDVTASIKTNFYILILAAFLMIVGGLPIMSMCHAAMVDRLEACNTAADPERDPYKVYKWEVQSDTKSSSQALAVSVVPQQEDGALLRVDTNTDVVSVDLSHTTAGTNVQGHAEGAAGTENDSAAVHSYSDQACAYIASELIRAGFAVVVDA